MRYQIRHTTRYLYPETVSLCHNRVQLQPVERADQRCLRFDLTLQPEPNLVRSYKDFFGNWIHYFEIHKPHRKLEITALSEVMRMIDGTPTLAPSPPWETVHATIHRADSNVETRRSLLFSMPSPLVASEPALHPLADQVFTPGRPLLAAVMDLTQLIHDSFAYAPGATSISTPLGQVLQQKAGVCQDFAHVAIGVLRSKGLAARYVSGYLETQPPPGQPKLQGSDASHAWFETFLPGSGWFGFDPTNAVQVAGRHIVLAVGRDYADVPPVKGVVTGGREHRLSVAVDVVPLAEELTMTPPAFSPDGGATFLTS
ncbi:MAG: transglutaminase family protein [Magnetococcales bacterium]|nr:transglutaminase family protein [Magnetococcales bacterium]